MSSGALLLNHAPGLFCTAAKRDELIRTMSLPCLALACCRCGNNRHYMGDGVTTVPARVNATPQPVSRKTGLAGGGGSTWCTPPIGGRVGWVVGWLYDMAMAAGGSPPGEYGPMPHVKNVSRVQKNCLVVSSFFFAVNVCNTCAICTAAGSVRHPIATLTMGRRVHKAHSTLRGHQLVGTRPI